MEPYYQDSAVTIYHGDCREILPSLDFDLLVTDPPYIFDKGGWGVKKLRTSYVDVAALDYGFDLMLLDSCANWICFCQKRQLIALLQKADSQGSFDLVTWYKSAPMPLTCNTMLPDVEYAVMCMNRTLGGDYKDKGHCYFSSNGANNTGHPTAKPLPLMVKLLILGGGEMACDPFCGSGTTLRAAKDLGRKAIGIEIEEKYCEIAAKRMAQEVFDFA